MDALSVTASIIAVLGAANAVISICCDYRSSVKGSSWEVSRILEDTRSLRSILQNLEGLADKAETSGSAEQSRLPALRSLCDPDTGILSSFYAELEKLTHKLTPPEWMGPAGSKRQGLAEALSWPLKKKDTEKVLDSITRYKDTISVAILADQIPSILAIEDATQETNVSLNSLKNNTHVQNVRNWLHPIDPHPKYAKTIDDRLPGTGAWLLEGRKFEDWKKGRDSRLWLYGIAGCGKTVLCSTAIENVLGKRSIANNKAIGVAYFYFDFNNRDQQYCDTMLRSLISQLWLQNRDDANAVDALHLACGSGASQPSSHMLKNTLKELVHSFMDTFIILDALDECKERQKLMPTVEEMAVWKLSSLHILFTSRKEKDIEDSLSTVLDDEQRICIQSAPVENDFRDYIRSRIRSDYGLRKWQKPEVQTEIETVLMEKAGGMFQWVKCQLDALGRCPNLSSLRKTLRSLPKDLDDTYARILQSIDDEEYTNLFARVVQWLAYSREPMSLADISEVLTVDPEDDHQFDVDRRLEDPKDLLRICSSFVTTVPRPEDPEKYLRFCSNSLMTLHQPGQHGTSPGSGEILQFAHFSVREYLESARIHDGPAKRYAIQEIHSNNFLAECCIIYLRHPDVLESSYRDRWGFYNEKYPFAIYAANYWVEHAERAEEGGNIIALSKAFSRGNYSIYKPLIYASIYNVPKITRALILEGANVNASTYRDWTPLMQILEHQHERIELVQLLLQHGANVNAQNHGGGTAIMIAAKKGKQQIVQILLDNGAAIQIVARRGWSALTLAAKNGHTGVVQLLLDRGVSIRHELDPRALIFASRSGRLETVRILLERGIGLDAESYDLTESTWKSRSELLAIALSRSLEHGHIDTAKLLLEHGADVNVQLTDKEKRGVLLQHVLNGGRGYMADALLEYGADPSLVAPEHLNEDGMRLYEERVLQRQIQDGSSRVEEGETEDAVADT